MMPCEAGRQPAISHLRRPVRVSKPLRAVSLPYMEAAR